MIQSSENTFNKKVKLICEYNRNSPLFVRMAGSEIDDNNVDEAIEVLSAGLNIYPDNPMAHLLLGKAYSLMGEYDKALEYFRKGSDLIHSNETFEFYRNKLESIRKQRSMFEVTGGNSFFNSSKLVDDNKNEPDLFNADSKNADDKKLADSIDDRLSQLAEEISRAKISTSKSSSLSNSDIDRIFDEDKLIISETLAKIYVAQNEYDEAIKVYEKLIEKEPEGEEHYMDMINEIRSKIDP